MTRLIADADAARWVPVTGRGMRGGRHRRAAIRMLLDTTGIQRGAPGSGLLAWVANRAARALLRHTDGRALAWAWREDPELVAVLAQVQELTPQLRAARAMMPIEQDDTEPFDSPHLGRGERLVDDFPRDGRRLLGATYTWDTGTLLVTVQAASADRERFGTVLPAVEELARAVRLSDDVSATPPDTIRLPPA